jgi:REP element-mobilizing transposase RayT
LRFTNAPLEWRAPGELESAMEKEPKGWYSRGYLPHFDAPELVQALTFRLSDSLPQQAIERLRGDSRARTRFEEALDQGIGACWLKQPAIAELVEDTLLHFDGQRYHLLAWCIMPNHVHAMIEQVQGERLGEIVSSWKRFSARRANERLGLKGRFWQEDYWDRFIRNEMHLAAAISYVENNPVKAGLVSDARLWPWSSARRRQ